MPILDDASSGRWTSPRRTPTQVLSDLSDLTLSDSSEQEGPVKSIVIPTTEFPNYSRKRSRTTSSKQETSRTRTLTKDTRPQPPKTKKGRNVKAKLPKTPTRSSGRGRGTAARSNNSDDEDAVQGSPTKKRKVEIAGPDPYAHLSGLSDRLKVGLDVVFCGINPGVMSAEVGFHFANPSNRFWPVLHLSEFTPTRLPPSAGRTLPDEYNLGLTDLVERPTAKAKEIKQAEKIASVPTLLEKIALFRPRIVCFIGLGISRIVRARATGGPKTQKDPMGLMKFKLVYPGDSATKASETLFWAMPSTSGANCNGYTMDVLATAFAELKEKAKQIKEGLINTQAFTVVQLPLPPLPV